MGVTWNEAEPEVFEVPRIDDELIDDAFYQEDEIGEMRHTAFMIECGLEEDPPDGPDVPPIPWKLEDLQRAADEAEAAKKKEEEGKEAKDQQKKTSPRRVPPKRTHSMDGGLVDLEEHLPQAAKAPEPKRGVAVTNSGGIFQNRPPRRKAVPTRTMSVDTYGKSGQAKLSIGLARTEKKSIGGPRTFTGSKSGSLLAMRPNLEKLAEGDEEAPPIGSPMGSPRRASKLVATKSGNLHGMRKALQNPAVKAVQEQEEDLKEESLNDEREYTKPVKREPVRGSLVVTKSGTSHGLRRVNRLERRDSRDNRSVDSTSTGDSFLSDFDSSSSDGSDVSIATDTSEEEEAKPKPKTPKEILQQIKADKVSTTWKDQSSI